MRKLLKCAGLIVLAFIVSFVLDKLTSESKSDLRSRRDDGHRLVRTHAASKDVEYSSGESALLPEVVRAHAKPLHHMLPPGGADTHVKLANFLQADGETPQPRPRDIVRLANTEVLVDRGLQRPFCLAERVLRRRAGK
jgi:hypothetical protein